MDDDGSLSDILNEIGNHTASKDELATSPGSHLIQRGNTEQLQERGFLPASYYFLPGANTSTVSLDAFDEELLRQPSNDRQRQAAQGLARISLAPHTGRHGMNHADRTWQRNQAFGAATRQKDNRLQQRLVEVANRNDGGIAPSSPPPSSPTLNACERRTVQRNQAQVHDPTAIPAVQGIPLRSLSDLPDRYRSIFPYPLFNAVQSKCFPSVYGGRSNFVLSAPTGSGKTAVLEMAICRANSDFQNNQHKIVYLAPTKALCSERLRDWQKKFRTLSAQCVELTGDTDHASMASIHTATIIITTPEKWDSITRRLKGTSAKTMSLVKLFLIDEVHLLKEDRGAILEVIVSRMKSLSPDIRFVAVSATVPNVDDIATWLTNGPQSPDTPALLEKFGEEFRPVRLQRHVCGYQFHGNDFMFDKILDNNLIKVITTYSQRKPIMIFCPTRTSAANTAKFLAKWWSQQGAPCRHWDTPRNPITFQDVELNSCAVSGVAFHHAGVESSDRIAVEKGYLSGDISVICCTSTLATGVNLPCHFVIIKNTMAYFGNVPKEYSDLEIMQMLGRAGRPQFDTSAIAVIMTKQESVGYYEKMLAGQEILESKLLPNLANHLNSEICLGTITDLPTAKSWISGTFLSVRIRQNPGHYRAPGESEHMSAMEKLENICNTTIRLLIENNLVRTERFLRPTEFGDIMSRCYVHFETMRKFLGLPAKAKLSEILSALAQADEFKDIRIRVSEKAAYKEMNQSAMMRFPINVDLALPAHKTSIVIQSVLGRIEFPTGEKFTKHRFQYGTDKATIFRSTSRLIRCIIDIQIELKDAIATRNALMLERSLGAQVWDDNPLQMSQIEGIGPVAVRKLIGAGLTSIEDLESAEPHRIECVLNRRPPFGLNLLDKLKFFPKLRISAKITLQKNEISSVRVSVKAELGFLNDVAPTHFGRKPVFVCFIAERSDGMMAHFARTSGAKLARGQDIYFSIDLTDHLQTVCCSVMCEEIAGTLRQATIEPNLPQNVFSRHSRQDPNHFQTAISEKPKPNTSRQRVDSLRSSVHGFDDFGDDGLDDMDLVQAATRSIYPESVEKNNRNWSSTQTNRSSSRKYNNSMRSKSIEPQHITTGLRRHPNGRWECNHQCKNKAACKHLCCREGLDKPPKSTAKKSTSQSSVRTLPKQANGKRAGERNQKKLAFGNQQPSESFDDDGSWTHIDHVDLTNGLTMFNSSKDDGGPALVRKRHASPTRKFGCKKSKTWEDKDDPAEALSQRKSDYSDSWIEDLPDSALLLENDKERSKLGVESERQKPSDAEGAGVPSISLQTSLREESRISSDSGAQGFDQCYGLGSDIYAHHETSCTPLENEANRAGFVFNEAPLSSAARDNLLLVNSDEDTSAPASSLEPGNEPLHAKAALPFRKNSADNISAPGTDCIDLDEEKAPAYSHGISPDGNKGNENLAVFEGVGNMAPSTLESIDPWILQEFGDVVEIV